VAYHVSSDEFARIADAALASIPEPLRTRMNEDNLLITVHSGSDPDEHVDERVLGYYEGGSSSTFSPYEYPKRIVLLQRHIERWSSSYAELVEQVTDTVLHEVAHYFGMSHRDISETRLRH
jgi:predicted Zn-dependent protease with MMP-like domain